MTKAEITRELSLPLNQIDRLLDGTESMSLPHQLGLAILLIERVPQFARQGHALRGQVDAAIAFDERQTRVHSQAPATWRALKRSPTSRRRA